MVKASVEAALSAELKDIVFDLVDLYNVALELQFHGNDLQQYNYWLKSAISYTIVARAALGSKENYKWPSYELNSYNDLGDLADLTKRININFQRIIMAYEKEAGDEMNQLLNTIRLCLIVMREYGR